jgi:hypothetical protein
VDPIPASIPFHVVRAYGLGRNPASQIEAKPRLDPHSNTTKLVAATVAQSIRFDAVDTFEPSVRKAEPAPSQPNSFPLYTRPADKNAAATAINAGRVLDTQA